MRFGSFAWGIYEIELTSGAPEEALTAIGEAGIDIRRLKKLDELTCRFWIPQGKLRILKNLAEKRGETLKIRKQRGLLQLGKQIRRRPVLVAGGLLLMLLVLWLPSRVLFVQVEGNHRIPEKRILEAAQDCGIGFGASRREVRSERMKNALLSQVPQLQWAGVNTSGCTATISVRERSDAREEETKSVPSSLVAARDGYILSATATKGTLLAKPGQSVTQGQLLISAYTDCGLSIRAEQAEGEVMAQTIREFQAVTPGFFLRKGETEGVKRKVSLLIGKKRINLWKDSGIWEDTCGRMYEEYYITLPGGFQLPAALCVEEYLRCSLTAAELPDPEAEASLKAFAQRALTQKMVAGKILTGVQSVLREQDRYLLRGRYACMEMIAKRRQEQIGDTNGKIN